MGSKEFVNNLTDREKENIKAMFSYDMVGMLEKNKGLNLKGIAGLQQGRDIANKYAQNINLLDLSEEIEERTDTQPFGRVGIPAIHVFTGLKSPYHKPEDKADLLDYDGMRDVAEYTAAVITDLANLRLIESSKTLKSVKENPRKVNNPLTFGVSGFLGLGKHLHKDEFYDAKPEVSYSIGTFLNYRISKLWAINVEGLFDENTSKSAQGLFKRHSLLIPLNLEFGNILYINAGAYYKHHFSGKDGDSDLDFTNEYRQNQWGYNYGFGVRFNKIKIGVVQRNSFQSIFQRGTKVVPNANYINIAYQF